MATDPFGAADGGYVPDPDRDTAALTTCWPPTPPRN